MRCLSAIRYRQAEQEEASYETTGVTLESDAEVGVGGGKRRGGTGANTWGKFRAGQ